MSIVDAFRQFKNLTPTQKLVAGTDMPALAIDTVQQLVQAGTTLATALGIGGQRADNFASGSAPGFFIGTAPERATAGQITQSQIAESGQSFAQSVSPELAIPGESSAGMTIYPPDLSEYYMSFVFYDYQRPNPFDKPTLSQKDAFALPLPVRGLNENHRVTWEEKNTGFLGDMLDVLSATNASNTNMEGAGARGAARSVVPMADSMLSKMGSKLAIASILPGDLDKQIGQSVGAILNPHLSQFFDGPTFQAFQFEWTFHPRTPDESTQLKEMCKKFKRFMLPSRAVQDVASFLAYPSIVQVQLNPPELLDHFKMKRCAITMANIDYAPFGQLVFFKGTKAPRSIKLTIELRAIEYFLSEDFGGTAKWATAGDFEKTAQGQLDNALNNGKAIATDLFKQGTSMLFGDLGF